MVYLRYRMALTPSLVNMTILTSPPWNRFMAKLHGLLPRSTLRIRLSLQYRNLLQHHDHRKLYLTCQVSKSRSIICIGSSPLDTVSDSTRFDVSYLIRLIISDLIQLTVFNSIWLSFYSIWLTFNEFIFYLSHIIRVPLQSGFRECHIVQGVFELIKHLNSGIFHNSENLNWFPGMRLVGVG